MHILTLYDTTPRPPARCLTDQLAALYDGDLLLPDAPRKPAVVANFVQSLDGIVSLRIPGKAGGADISGRNEEDAFLMGLLRACADAVMIGEDTFRNAPGHMWTPGCVYPALAKEFLALRTHLGKPSEHPLNVIVSGMGQVNLNERLFTQEEVASLVLTTARGAAELHRRYGDRLPAAVRILPGEAVLNPADMVALLHADYGVQLLLHEGGPRLFSSFLTQGLIDELFLTIAPQIVGRGESGERPNVSGPLALDPEQAIWGTLHSVKCADSGHLFLRYRVTQ
jgi:riboflavin biosynthesis pyrimidine reductase